MKKETANLFRQLGNHSKSDTANEKNVCVPAADV